MVRGVQKATHSLPGYEWKLLSCIRVGVFNRRKHSFSALTRKGEEVLGRRCYDVGWVD